MNASAPAVLRARAARGAVAAAVSSELGAVAVGGSVAGAGTPVGGAEDPVTAVGVAIVGGEAVAPGSAPLQALRSKALLTHSTVTPRSPMLEDGSDICPPATAD